MKNNQTTGNVPIGVELTEAPRPEWHNSCPWVYVPKSTNMTCNIGLPGSQTLFIPVSIFFFLTRAYEERQIVLLVLYVECVAF